MLAKKVIYGLGILLSCVAINYANSGFVDMTPDTYDKIWAIGSNFKPDRKLENPVLYGIELRSGGGGAASLITPATITKYLSYSKDERLVFPPADFKNTMLNNKDYVYIATYAMHLKNLLTGGVMPQLPSQRLLIEKDGQYIMPAKMDTQIYDMMPHSYAIVYYAYPKNVIYNTPYTIKFINGNGDRIEIPITADKLNNLIDKENKLVYQNSDPE